MENNNKDFSRHVSLLTRDTLALILAGGRGSRLYELTKWRAKPALYFGGKYRIIDFPLSNCINSGVRRMGILTQYKAHSLIRHLVRGWSWFQAGAREFVEILPASQRVGGEWYRGTADARTAPAMCLFCRATTSTKWTMAHSSQCMRTKTQT
jgi:glucose-1-phosphate adenylyltransferase